MFKGFQDMVDLPVCYDEWRLDHQNRWFGKGGKDNNAVLYHFLDHPMSDLCIPSFNADEKTRARLQTGGWCRID